MINYLARGPFKWQVYRIANWLNSKEKFADFVYNTSTFRKLGMMSHDMIRMDTELTKQARARLPKDIAAERQFRISRAVLTSQKNQILPKEEWMTRDQEVPYMTEYLNMVEKEQLEKAYYKKKIYKPIYKIQNTFSL